MPRKPSSPIAIQHAHDLRHRSTQAEAKLWTYLRTHRINDVHFRRQHAIGNYIVDFCAPKEKLIIEVDGSQHMDDEIQDLERANYLQKKGYRILRFWNHEVMNYLEGVINAIQQALSDLDMKT